MTKALLAVMAAVLPLSLALVCPTFSCADLPLDSCALKVDEASAKINNNACSQGKFCSGERLYHDWWWSSSSGIGTYYPCLNATSYKHLTTGYKDNYSRWACYGRETGKDLEIGVNPKDCASDHDCKHSDGSLGSCQCGFRQSGTSGSTKGICVPDISSSVFDNYWKACNSLGYIASKTGGGSADFGFYYKVLQETYPIINNLPVACASGTLWEFQLLSLSLLEIQAHGVYLALGVWAAFY